MQLSQTSEYAVRALLYLATQPENTLHRISVVAEAAEIPDNYFRKILGALVRAGFIRSIRGVNGGIQLAMSPSNITLLDVFESIEGKLFLNACLISPYVCHRSSWCAVHEVWVDIQDQMKTRLQAKTLAELAENSARNQSQIESSELPVVKP